MGPESGAGFFAVYGDAVGPMWRAYQTRLAELVEDGACAPDKVLDSARQTFDALTRWLDGDAAIAGAA
jgi:heme oxygenase